jgi:predicted oxidoreductase
MFGDRPTALWLPRAQTNDGSFGVRSNQFGFNIIWADRMTVAVEACTNLTNPVWSPLQTNTLTGGSSYFSDPQWTNQPARFYRLHSP